MQLQCPVFSLTAGNRRRGRGAPMVNPSVRGRGRYQYNYWAPDNNTILNNARANKARGGARKKQQVLQSFSFIQHWVFRLHSFLFANNVTKIPAVHARNSLRKSLLSENKTAKNLIVIHAFCFMSVINALCNQVLGQIPSLPRCCMTFVELARSRGFGWIFPSRVRRSECSGRSEKSQAATWGNQISTTVITRYEADKKNFKPHLKPGEHRGLLCGNGPAHGLGHKI